MASKRDNSAKKTGATLGAVRHRKPAKVSSKTAKKIQYKGSLEQNIVKLALDGELAKIGPAEVTRQLSKGLSVTYQVGNEIIRHHPNGDKEVLEVVENPPFIWPKGVKVLGKR